MRFSDLSSNNVRGQLLRAFGAGMSMRVLAVIASLLSSIALARTLGPETYGTYAFVLSLIVLLALPVQMGLPTLITRETAKAITLQDWGLLRGIWSWSVSLVMIGEHNNDCCCFGSAYGVSEYLVARTVRSDTLGNLVNTASCSGCCAEGFKGNFREWLG